MQLKLRGDGNRYMEWDFSALSLPLFYIGNITEFTMPKTHLANLNGERDCTGTINA